MASNGPINGNRPCLICLEVPAVLQIIPECNHTFCESCLTKHIQKHGPNSAKYPCPMCILNRSLPTENLIFDDGGDLIDGEVETPVLHRSFPGTLKHNTLGVNPEDDSGVNQIENKALNLIDWDCEVVPPTPVASSASSKGTLVGVDAVRADANVRTENDRRNRLDLYDWSFDEPQVPLTTSVSLVDRALQGSGIAPGDIRRCRSETGLDVVDLSSDEFFITPQTSPRGLQERALELRSSAVVKENSLVCRSCRFSKKLNVLAESLCEECGALYLCKDCTNVHRKNQSTAKHVVIALKRRLQGCCRTHEEVINRYCRTCSVPCCSLCVLFNHGDHTIESIGEVFQDLVKDLSNSAQTQRRRSENLIKCADKLNKIKSSDVAERKALLVEEIQDHAESCKTYINTQKESMIKQVTEKYRVVKQASDCLGCLPSLGQLNETLAKLKTLLSAVEPHPDDIKKLKSIKKDLARAGIKEDIDIDTYLDSYRNLKHNPIHFVPTNPSFLLGELEVREGQSPRDINSLNLIHEKILEADDPAMIIPCVANLGNDYYAVAHPALEGRPSEAIDIYKVPGEFVQTFRDHAESVYDMAATPDGTLAVLSVSTRTEQTEQACSHGSCLRLFHPVNGYMESQHDFPIRNPLSFDVNFCNQYMYVILSNDGGRRVTVCHQDATLDYSHPLEESDGVKDAYRIVCSRKYIYVLGKKRFAIYEPTDKTLSLVVNSENEFTTLTLTDISVTDFDEITVCYEQAGTGDEFWFGRCSLVNGALSGWNIRVMTGQARRTRLSRNHDYMVTSQEGTTIRVYEESTT